MTTANCAEQGRKHEWRPLTEEEARKIETIVGTSVLAPDSLGVVRDIRHVVRKCSICEDIE